MELPDFPQSMPVDMDSRPLFFEAYRNSPPPVADMVFNSLFGWQELFDYRVSRQGDFLLVFYREGRQMVMLPPLMVTGTVADAGWGERFLEAARAVDAHCRENGMEAVFRGFPDQYVRRFPSSGVAVVPERDSFDYIYRKDDLVNLAGQTYAPKRNLIRQFTRKYAYHYEPLNKDNLSRVQRFLHRWQPAAGKSSRGIASGEYRMVERLLSRFDELQLCGGILAVDGQDVAATIATIVPDFAYGDGIFSTAVVHSEHAQVEYKGSYQIINQLFCSRLPESVVFINREEDLGLPGLRKAKLSYGPVRLLEKNRIIVRS